MTRCPHCSSYNTEKQPQLHLGHGGLHAAAHLGYGLFAAAAWLTSKVINAVQNTFKCNSCGKTFS